MDSQAKSNALYLPSSSSLFMPPRNDVNQWKSGAYSQCEVAPIIAGGQSESPEGCEVACKKPPLQITNEPADPKGKSMNLA